MNKKGFGQALQILGIIAFIVIALPIFTIFMSDFNDGLQAATNVTLAKESASTISTGFTDTADSMGFMFICAIYIGALLLALFLQTDPIFLIGGIIVMILFLWLGAYIADAYYDITQEGAFSDEVNNNYPLLKFYMTWFLEINIGFVALVLAATYMKG